ncbi:hypothetical protein GCM10010124_22750 [Pilimelia terevasa]|uniref:Glycerophosphoryl diester phosphodiesterase membrane domain-containing protein n=1 Tax=Pilimelia terevasa TaxID=53372 RepID=A0A8J3FJK3_9ACTN|nr:hypothetical protein [Pilimelia terevasa]GGK29472.1 hypothetical protein GCM10010124_22750 [Pilimelia terevasa]
MTTPPPDPGPPPSEPPADRPQPVPPPHPGHPPNGSADPASAAPGADAPPGTAGPSADSPGHPGAVPAPGQPPAGYPVPGFGAHGYPPAGYSGPGVHGYGDPASGAPVGYWPAGPGDALVNPPHAGFGGWWARVVAVWRGTLGRLLAIAALTQLLPLAVFGGIGVVLVLPRLDALPVRGDSVAADPTEVLTAFLPLLGLGVVAGIGFLLAGAVATGATMRLVVGYAAGQQWGVGDAVRYGVRRMWGVLGWTVVVGLVNLGFALLCLVPVLYSAFATSLVMMAYLCERHSPVGRSWKLTHARFGDVLGRVVVVVAVLVAASAVVGIIGTVLSLPFSWTPGDRPDAVAVLGQAGVYFVQQVLALPAGTFAAVAIAAVYAEARAAEAPVSAASLAAEMDR